MTIDLTKVNINICVERLHHTMTTNINNSGIDWNVLLCASYINSFNVRVVKDNINNNVKDKL